jgi:hypothetical protein
MREEEIEEAGRQGMKRLTLLLGIVAITALAVPAMAVGFGFSSADSKFEIESGPATLAGSHPDSQTTEFSFQTLPYPPIGSKPDGAVQNVSVQLPAGFVGNPTAVGQCTHEEFVAVPIECSPESQVGEVIAQIFGPPPSEPQTSKVYNLVPPRGDVLQLGVSIASIPVTVDVKVSPNPPFNVEAVLRYTSNETQIYGSTFTIDNDPPGATAPFLTLPRACTGPLPTIFQATSWEEPSSLVQTQSASSLVTTGCDQLGFGPTVKAAGTNTASESPSGLDFDLEVDDPGLVEEGQRADSDIEKAVVTLPEGMTTNPSVAAGLTACSEAQFNAEGVEFDPATGCPGSSNVGSVEVTTPLLNEKLSGQIYVAKQGDNPFDSLLALYMVIRNEKLGIVVRQPLKIDPDPQTGRLVSTVSEIPQLPFSDFHLHFREGPRAPLITPATCGNYAIDATLYPYAQGLAPVQASAGLTVDKGAGGGDCAAAASGLPHAPTFSAGTLSPLAGAYSPFLLRLSRADGSQQIRSISTTLPEGLLGRLVGTSYCPESGIAQAEARSGEGQGALEIAQPSCPHSSEVGTVRVASGAGPSPLQVSGRAYLAGPYKGAPLSLEIITPAIAGPFDLGVVAVRTALQVDPRTAQITAESDPIPTILHGLPLDVRQIALDMDRPDFTLNPTSCEPKAIVGSATSILGAVKPLSAYFQASDCDRLKFKPKLSLRLKGSTKRSGHPSLKATLTYPKGSYANIARAQVGLPHSEFLDQGNIKTVCTQPQLKSATCPKKAIYGRAKAWSPLLDKPLEGPVYLGVGYGHALPDLVADLDGQIRVLLNGKVDTNSRDGLRNTFEAVPDAPVSKFTLELYGGPKKGLLENSENVCRKLQRASMSFVAQNARRLTSRVPILNDCGNSGHGG